MDHVIELQECIRKNIELERTNTILRERLAVYEGGGTVVATQAPIVAAYMAPDEMQMPEGKMKIGSNTVDDTEEGYLDGLRRLNIKLADIPGEYKSGLIIPVGKYKNVFLHDYIFNKYQENTAEAIKRNISGFYSSVGATHLKPEALRFTDRLIYYLTQQPLFRQGAPPPVGRGAPPGRVGGGRIRLTRKSKKKKKSHKKKTKKRNNTRKIKSKR